MSQRSKPPPTAPLLSLASVTPKTNFHRERKATARLSAPHPESALSFTRSIGRTGFKGLVLGRTQNQPWHAMARNPQLSPEDFPFRQKASLKTYSTHIIPGHAIPAGSFWTGGRWRVRLGDPP